MNESLAEMTWFVYDLSYDQDSNRYKLVRHKTVYTLFEPTLFQLTKIEVGPIDEFIATLQQHLDAKLEDLHGPDIASSLNDIIPD